MDKLKEVIKEYRNSIHHPENEHNAKYTNEELKLSIQQMAGIL